MDVASVAPERGIDLVHPDAAAVVACRRAVVRQAAASIDHILELVAGAIFDELAEYGTGRSRGEVEDIRTGIRRSIELCLATIADARPVGDEELAVVRTTGAQRARQGISKHGVVTSVRIAVRVGRTYLMSSGDMGHDADVLLATHRQIGGMLDRFEDQVTVALAEGWDDAYGRLLAGGDRGEAILVDRLLARRFHDEEEVLAHAVQVGLAREAASWVVLACPADGADDRSLAAAAAALRDGVRLAAGPTSVTPRVHLPLIVQPSPRNESPPAVLLERVAQETGVVLVAADQPAPLTRLSATYASVRDGLPFLAAATIRPGLVAAVVLRFHRALCAGNPADWRDLVEDVLRPLHAVPPREAADLLETLDELCEAGSSGSELARRLHLHKNTVNNRLRRAQLLLGLDLRNPAERLVLEAVLRLRRVVDAVWV